MLPAAKPYVCVKHSVSVAVVVLIACSMALLAGYANKARCTGGHVFPDGRSEVFEAIRDSDVCYSDIQKLWLGRDINNHVIPYVHGGLTEDGQMTGGSVEYPVLTGMIMWAGAYWANNDAQFLYYSAFLLAPFALVTAWMLARLSGRWALYWAIAPPLILYAFHNWELPVVLASVAAIYIVAAAPWSLRKRGVLAAVLLGLGFCLKLYPGAFVLPLMLYVLTGGAGGRDLDARTAGRYDWVGALQTGFAAAATVVAINLPFALTNFNGWAASIEFQRARLADITTNSIWYWGYHAIFHRDAANDATFQDLVSRLSPTLILVSFGFAVYVGWRRYLATGTFNWVGVSGAMLCGFILFHKVDSPQYILWMLPFLVVIAIPWPAVTLYIAANAAVGIGVFRYFFALAHHPNATFEEGVVTLGVWGQAVALLWILVGCLWTRSRISVAPSSTPPTGSSTPPLRTRSSVGL